MGIWNNNENDIVKRNRDKELAQKRMDRNYEIAAKSIVPRMNIILFSMMILCSFACGAAEYLSVLKAKTEGYDKFYNVGISFKSAFIMWVFLGIFVLVCYVLEKRNYQKWVAETHLEILEQENSTEYTDILPELRRNSDEVSRKSKLKKEKMLKEREIRRAEIFALITLIGFVILGLGSVAL